MNIAVINGDPSSCVPFTCIVQTAPEPSAIEDSGLTCASAFNNALGKNMPTTCLAVPGWGNTALTIEPFGALIFIGLRLPKLFGISGFKTDRTVKVV